MNCGDVGVVKRSEDLRLESSESFRVVGEFVREDLDGDQECRLVSSAR